MFRSYQRAEKSMKHEGGCDTNCSWGTWNGPQRLKKKLGVLEVRGRIETIQIVAQLRLTRIPRRVIV